jgi:hypothetical protein
MHMNLQLSHVVTDITGLTDRRIIDDILSGDRDPTKLAALRDRRCKESVETIAAALEGNYQEEHLFEFKSLSRCSMFTRKRSWSENWLAISTLRAGWRWLRRT